MFIETILIELLAIWLAVSMVYQCFTPQLKHLTARFDRFRIIPAWRFFATPPRDCDLECQYDLSDGSRLDWESPLPRRSHPLIAALWNPRYMVPDLGQTWLEELIAILESTPPFSDQAIQSCFCHRALVNYINCVAPSGAVRGQFRIVERLFDGADDAVMFMSPEFVIDADHLEIVEMPFRNACDAGLAPMQPTTSFRRAG